MRTRLTRLRSCAGSLGLWASALLVTACTGSDPDGTTTDESCGGGGLSATCTDTDPPPGDGEADTADDETAGDTEAEGVGDTASDESESAGDEEGACVTDEDCPPEHDCDEGMCVPICGENTVTLEAPPPPVMLVLDKSGSMVNNVWDHDGDPGTPDETRWATLYTVTDFILTQFEGSIQFGLQLFPSTSATTACANVPDCPACDVAGAPEMGVAIDNRDEILGVMPAMSADSTAVAGATPAAAGLTNAKAALDAVPPVDGVSPAIVLITDGAANCGLQYADEPCEFPGDGTSASCELMDYYDDQLEGLVAGYAAEGVNTFVVGIDIVDEVSDPMSEYNFSVDDTNVYNELNAVAMAGGVPQAGSEAFYNATNEAELQDALNEIAGIVASCEISLADDPPDASQIPYVEFEVDGMEVDGPLDISEQECLDGAASGWIWLVEGESVLFCGAACDSLKATLEVDGTYGCPPPD